MRKPEPSRKIRKEDAKQPKQPAKSGPVELTPEDMKKVSGGLPCSWPKPRR